MIAYKRFIFAYIFVVIVLTLSFNVYAAPESLLYETKEKQTITDGVVYEKSTRLYDRGWTYIHALIIDITNPNVKLDVLESPSEYGIKHSVENLARSSGALAAVNGDFFGTGEPRSSMGIVVRDGKINATRNYYNLEKNNYAGIYIDSNNNPFIDYLKIKYIGFFGANTARIQLDSKNKVTPSTTRPIYFDRSAATSTADLDKRTKDLSKIVVTGDTISYVSAPGETVNVPENGYVIVLDKKTADADIKYFHVGDKASYQEYYTFSGIPDKTLDSIKLGLSGGSKILQAGVTVEDGLIIEKTGRPSRTIVGLNKERTQLIILTADGRTSSVGLTHYECAEVMREYGAYDAFHLDGGGSTTFISRNEGESEISLRNIVSDGNQRRVANALGVFSTNQTGSLSGMVISVNNKKENIIMMAGRGYTIDAKGYDQNRNPVPAYNVSYSSSGIEGTFNGNVFTPKTSGVGKIIASSAGVTSEIDVKAVSAASALKLNPTGISTKNGQKTAIKVRLVNEDGYYIDLNPSQVSWSVSPSIGLFDGNGVFTATSKGKAVITASYGGLTGQASVAVGTTASTVESYETDSGLLFTPYPTTINGSVSYSNEAKDKSRSVKLTYTFLPNQTKGQSASIDYKNSSASILPGYPVGLGMWVKSDASGYEIKMNIKDSAGKVTNIDFKSPLTVNGWKYVYGSVPENVAYPIALDKIYVIAPKTATTKTSDILIDNIMAEYLTSPDSGVYVTGGVKDPMRKEFAAAPEQGETEIAVFGPTAWKTNELASVVLTQALAKMQMNAEAIAFAGYTKVNQGITKPCIQWLDRYELNGTGNITTISLATSKGGLRLTNAQQWRSLQNDLNNMTKKNIVILTNKDIWSQNDGFSDSRERDIFHNLLKQHRERTGANIIVVAGCTYETKVNAVDGIRYITLNGLLSKTYDLNNDYYVLKIRATADNMSYDLQPIYKNNSLTETTASDTKTAPQEPMDDVPFVD